MNQKDYKEIAEIIKRNTAPENDQYNDLSIVGDCLIDDLADYFGKTKCPKCDSMDYNALISGEGECEGCGYKGEYKATHFNKKQFLKACGVEE